MKIRNVVLTIILVIVLSITVGFSAFVSEMSISNLVADVRIEKDVRITNVSIADSYFSNGEAPTYITYDDNSIITSNLFTSIDDYLVLDVTITNIGSADVGIYFVSSTSGISTDFFGYTMREKICDDSGKCNLGISKTIQVDVWPGSSSGLNLDSVKLDFDFREFHKITYEGIINNNYPTEVIDGGTLSITFTDTLERVQFLSNNVEVAYYELINAGQTITLSDVIDDVVVNVKGPLIKLVSGSINEVGSEVCIDDECFYIVSNDGATVSMLAKYNLYVGGDYNSSWVAYGDEATGIQNETMLGYVSGQTLRRGTTLFSDVDGSYSGSVVEGYINNYMEYLISLGAQISKSRLMTFDELKTLGCEYFNYTCKDAPAWVYSTSYWGAQNNTYHNLCVQSNGYYYDDVYDYSDSYGVRPVIEISVGDIYVPTVATLVSGDYDTVGSEVCLGNECFYVISSTDDSVTMLSKYNLLVGNSVDENWSTTPLSNPTGIQDSSARGLVIDDENNSVFPFIGTVSFSNSSSLYKESSIKVYVDNYGSYLNSKGFDLEEIRLLTFDEIMEFSHSLYGDEHFTSNEYDFSSAPDWLYYTSYWIDYDNDSSLAYRIDNSANLYQDSVSLNDECGVRPVITILKSSF